MPYDEEVNLKFLRPEPEATAMLNTSTGHEMSANVPEKYILPSDNDNTQVRDDPGSGIPPLSNFQFGMVFIGLRELLCH